METIGFVGLGHMGSPMAKNLLKAGYRVQVYDVVANAVKAAVQDGAVACDELSDVTRDADIIFTMVQTGQQVREILLGEGGLLVQAATNTLFIEASTIDVETSRFCHTSAIENGMQMLDAPVSGGVAGAVAATLTMMVGGSSDNFKRAQPILKQLGKNIIHAGAAGNGQVAKMCNNMVLATSMIAISEAFNLGEQLGLTPKTFFDIATKSSAQCWALSQYCPSPNILENVPSSNDYQAGFTAAMMLKDLGLAQDAAGKINANTPLGKHAMKLYQAFVDDGYENLDFSAIYRTYGNTTYQKKK